MLLLLLSRYREICDDEEGARGNTHLYQIITRVYEIECRYI